jgi:hypothetical protein
LTGGEAQGSKLKAREERQKTNFKVFFKIKLVAWAAGGAELAA